MAPTPTRKPAAWKSKPASANGKGRAGGPVTPDYEIAIPRRVLETLAV